MEVKVHRHKGDPKPLTLEYDFGISVADAVAKFNTPGPYGDVVHHYFIAEAKMQLSNYVRSLIAEGTKPLDVQTRVKDWRPVIKHRGKPPVDRALEAAKDLTREERQELVSRLLSHATYESSESNTETLAA